MKYEKESRTNKLENRIRFIVFLGTVFVAITTVVLYIQGFYFYVGKLKAFGLSSQMFPLQYADYLFQAYAYYKYNLKLIILAFIIIIIFTSTWIFIKRWILAISEKISSKIKNIILEFLPKVQIKRLSDFDLTLFFLSYFLFFLIYIIVAFSYFMDSPYKSGISRGKELYKSAFNKKNNTIVKTYEKNYEGYSIYKTKDFVVLLSNQQKEIIPMSRVLSISCIDKKEAKQ